jgi:WD40 repeat protein
MIDKDQFLQNAMYSIRILNQAKFHKEYVQYRNYPEIIKNEKVGMSLGATTFSQQKKSQEQKTEDNSSSKCLVKLFSFYNENLFEERTVSCLDWNPINNDLLAATYGEFELAPRFKKESLNNSNLEGALAFWTLKSPEFPERVIKTSSRAISCKFSPRNPNLIGVGLYDGVIAIYDIRKKGNQPIADSKELDLKHLDVVWDVNWIQKGNTTDKGEGLVSISSDGKIIEWSIKKGLESQELKLLNRVTNPQIKNDKADTINFRYTTGFR